MSMSFLRAFLAFTFSAALIAVPATASRVHRAPTSGQSHHSHSGQAHRSHSAKAAHQSDSDQASTSSPERRSGKTGKAGRNVVKAKVTRSRGQQAIASERVMQIQQALIREHYMSGEATGEWDSNTVAAMQKFQADQGWQTKLMPDSRALKKLGLGPDYSNAINAKNSTFADPPPASTIPADQASGFMQASGVRQ
jgi:peptidoglycan hydrolase-like protein with peptidoglycan-binding domain